MPTLTESLTALAIFSIGASGSATWLTRSSLRVSNASVHTNALRVAADLASRMQANREAARRGDYGFGRESVGRELPPTGGGVDCYAGCTGADIARRDLAVFRGGLARAAGREARGDIACGLDVCLIDLRWPGGSLRWAASL